MTDIVERLRQEIGGYTDTHFEKAEADMREAADKIERLQREQGYLIHMFRVNMMAYYNDYTHEEFDTAVAKMLEQIDE